MFKLIDLKFIVLFMLLSPLYADEPSLYGAGDLNSASPYGLSANERFMLDTKREVISLRSIVTTQQGQLEALIALVDTLNVKVAQLEEANREKIDVSTLKADIYRDIKEQNDKNYKLMLDLGSSIDKIEKDYVSTTQVNELLAQFKTNSELKVTKELSASESYSNASKAFGAKDYTQARVLFEKSLAKNYNLASSNYYLGEIAFLDGSYSDALGYYKASASLDDKAKYMDNLFYHSAMALENIGDKVNAKAFYDTLIKRYPKSNLAKNAKERLKKL